MSAYSDKIAAGSADAMLGPNPIVGFRARDVVREMLRAGKLAVSQPKLTAKAVGDFGTELRRILGAQSELAPQARDKRFADAAWKDDPRYRRWLQSYLAMEK